MTVELQPLCGPLTDEQVGWIVDLYGPADVEYSSAQYVRHQFVENPFGWSVNVFAVDYGRAVGHCGVIPFRARRGSEYCFWHDPELEEARLEELERREELAGAPILAEAVPLETVEDVQAMLKQVATYLATSRRVDPGRARALTLVANQLLGSIKIRQLQKELTAARAEIQRLQRRCAALEELREVQVRGAKPVEVVARDAARHARKALLDLDALALEELGRPLGDRTDRRAATGARAAAHDTLRAGLRIPNKMRGRRRRRSLVRRSFVAAS